MYFVRILCRNQTIVKAHPQIQNHANEIDNTQKGRAFIQKKKK